MQRRSFLKNAAVVGTSVLVGSQAMSWPGARMPYAATGKRVGVIGLDTSHSVEFTRVLNTATDDSLYNGYRVTAAYPYGSRTIASSYNRIPGYIDKVKTYGVTICASLEELLQQVDCVLLETNDGRLHPEQAAIVFQSHKPVFIDKPLGANLAQVQQVYSTAAKYGQSFFTSSALRFTTAINKIREDKATEKVLGALTFSPCTIEPTHEDLYWYGIHGVEMLLAVMGPGCRSVQATHTADTEIATGVWEDGRIGTFRGMRTGVNAFGGIVYGEKRNIVLGDYEGYEGLLKNIIRYFETGQSPVPVQETKEIYSFMSAFQKSKQHGGKPVKLKPIQ
jgi:predicted dehydrogenase